MTVDTGTAGGAALVIAAMAAVSFLTRAAGFFLMRFVAVTPLVEAWLRALPLAVMGAILAPIAVHGGPPEWIGFAATFLVWRVKGDDILAALAGVVAVAAARALIG
ncbi:AzlD family protein [Prosthecomicrobium pneumaticum]|uniref:Putative membrane protein n=1 Tax=Prosthecomicrobium pneumaticum TaxID=81895 RepID=A0A7W9FLU3_9HYPH|nr:AzlD domain-containing protein [Prosthecomicrobium pneumaticum]MBB5752996.1 putative membrane protein [Prosthecomicrobium pneumaticum]